MRQKKFRQDLFDRLSVFVIDIPPLRDRPEDIVPLASEFLRQFNEKWYEEIEELKGAHKKLSPAAERELQRYDWPGNIRELQSLMMRLGVHTISRNPEITPEDIRRIQSIGTAPQSTSLNVEPLGDGFDMERALDRVRYYYVQEAEKKSERQQIGDGTIASGYNSRTPLSTILKNLKKAGYTVDN